MVLSADINVNRDNCSDKYNNNDDDDSLEDERSTKPEKQKKLFFDFENFYYQNPQLDYKDDLKIKYC